MRELDWGIGQPVPRSEDARLTSGLGRYTDDLDVGQAASLYLVRSPHAAARIVSIEVSAARAAPGVLAVLTGDDVLAENFAPLPSRVQRHKGNGEPNFVPPYYPLAVGVAPHSGVAVAAVVAETLAEASSRWDGWILRCVPPESPLVPALRPAGLRSLVRAPIAAPAIELPAGFDAYLAGLPGSRRQNLRKHLRRLDSGEVELTPVTDPERLDAVVERWQRFRKVQWEAAGRAINPEHLSPRFAAFMLDVLRRLVPRGTAAVWEFRVQGRVVGTYVNFVDAAAFFWYLGGFDPAVTRLGLGKIAIGHGCLLYTSDAADE